MYKDSIENDAAVVMMGISSTLLCSRRFEMFTEKASLSKLR
jgi:hypothetical protein